MEKVSLKSLIKSSKLRYKDISKITGIKSNSTISLKLNRKYPFTVDEALKLIDAINNKLNTNYILEEIF